MSHTRRVKILGDWDCYEENENHKFMSDSSFFGVFGVFYVRTMRLVQFMTYNNFQKSRMIETCINCQQLPIRSARYATWMDLYFYGRKSDSNDNERPDYRVCTTCVLQRYCQWSTWLLLFFSRRNMDLDFKQVLWIRRAATHFILRYSETERKNVPSAGTEAVPQTANSTRSVSSPQRSRLNGWQRPSSEDGLIACTS